MAKLLINTPELSTILVEDEYFYPYTPGLREVLDAIKDWDPEGIRLKSMLNCFHLI